MIAALAGCAAGFAMQTAWPFAPWSAVAASLSGGLGIGVLAAVTRSPATSELTGIELVLGILLGIYVFQFGLLLAGFTKLAVCVVAVIGLRGLWVLYAPSLRPASPHTSPGALTGVSR